jgi:hypothetical protein
MMTMINICNNNTFCTHSFFVRSFSPSISSDMRVKFVSLFVLMMMMTTGFESGLAAAPGRAVVIGSVFRGAGKEGDFAWMARQPEFANTLFIFNDNEEQFSAFVSGDREFGCKAGGGNAAIRPLRKLDPPRAAGIPTGSSGSGYKSLTPEVREMIDLSLAQIRSLLATGRYDRVVFSQDAERPTLGTGIFRVGEDVKEYIYASLLTLT